MAEFSAKNVAALRKQTGAGMMDCKKALEETGGDIEAAKSWLRERNLAGSSTRAGREAAEGTVDVAVVDKAGAVVELNCETDFVAKGGQFTEFVAKLTRHVAEHNDDDLAAQPFDGSTIGEAITQLGGTLGEKVELGRVVRYESPDGLLDAYKHVQNERGVIGVLVELGGVDPSNAAAQELAHDLALHIASAAPRYVSRDEVPDDVVAKEREVFEALTRNEGKPEQALPKIVEGRLGGFYKEVVLVEQGFVREPKKSVRTLLESLGPDALVRRFARVKIGED